MFYEKIRIKQGLSYIPFCPLRILYNSKFILMATSLGRNTVGVTRLHCTNIGNLKVNWYTFRGETTLSWLFCLPYEKGSTWKGMSLFPFKVDPFSKGGWCAEKEMGSHNTVHGVILHVILHFSLFAQACLSKYIWYSDASIPYHIVLKFEQVQFTTWCCF